MSRRLEELDWRETPIGEISLRRRLDPTLRTDVYEVKLGDEFLMSSLFTVAEEALATLGLAALDRDDLDVVNGGLGLAYTAGAALADPRVRSLHVVEYLEPVIDWHERRLLPLSPPVTDDPRCHLVHGDFFALVAAGSGFGGGTPSKVDAVLLDIDHTPSHVLNGSHSAFYTLDGLTRVADRLNPGGVFALWSDEPPDDAFLAVLRQVFATAEGHLVEFPNPLTGGTSSNGVYVAVR
ncbi:MAG: spermidine synthase [Frankiales bacterium]|nr:spermidine synthase [Frankiales bacterium]